MGTDNFFTGVIMLGFDPVIIGASLILASGGGDLCAMDAPTELHIKPSSARLKIDTSQSLKQLQKANVDTISPHSFNGMTVTKGLMEGRIAIEPEVALTNKSYDSRGVGCVWYDKITVRLDIDPNIRIAREVKEDKCMYNAVLEHERKHVAVDRRIINKYARIIGTEIQTALDERGYVAGPLPLNQVKSVGQRMQKTIFQIVDFQMQKMSLERKEAQQAIDSKEEYERVGAMCPEFNKKYHSQMEDAAMSAMQ